MAQELYDGQGKKIITYPRAEVRYLPQSLMSDVPRIVAGLRVGQSFSTIPVPDPPIIRKGASGTFYDKGLEGASHHAVIPNVNRGCRGCRDDGERETASWTVPASGFQPYVAVVDPVAVPLNPTRPTRPLRFLSK